LIGNGHGGPTNIVKRLAHSIGFFLKCSLLAGLIGGALAFPHLQRRVDEEIRRRIEATLAAHYARYSPNLTVTVRSAERVQGKGFIARGIKVVDRTMKGDAAEVVNIEELRLSCCTDMEELIKGEPAVTHVLVRRPTIRASRRLDGTWSTAGLLPLPDRQPAPREIAVENGTVEIIGHAPTTTVLRDINVSFVLPESPATQPMERAASERTASAMGPEMDMSPAGPPRPTATARNGSRRHFRGTFSGNRTRRVEIEGAIDPNRSEWNISGSIAALEITPEFRDALPEEWAAQLRPLGQLRAEADVKFQIKHDPAAQVPLQFSASGNLSQGRFDDPRLPRPLSDIRSRFEVSNSGIDLRGLVARSGQTTIRMSAHRKGFADTSPMVIDAEIQELELDQSLLETLPDSLRTHWLKYHPTGKIDARLKLTFDGESWHPEFLIQCQNVSFAFYKVPYRLEYTTGRLELKDDVFTLQLIAFGSNRRVRIDGEIRQPFSEPVGWVDVASENVPIDEKLLTALPEKARDVVRSLDPRGTIDVSSHLWCDAPDDTFHCRLIVTLNRCAIRYQRFPYPINNIRGTLEMLDDRWTSRNLTGSNGTGSIRCDVLFQPPSEGGELQLDFKAENILLENELRDALPTNMQQVWNDFHPAGMVDLPRVFVVFQPSDKRLNVKVIAKPISERTSIQPVYFPYRLDRLQGILEYSDGQVTLSDLRAQHGNVKASAKGVCTFLPDGSWRFALQNLYVDRLQFDRELLPALPGPFRKTIAAMAPAGPFNLSGTLVLARSGVPDAPLTSFWNVDLNFQQGALDVGLKLDQLHGATKLIGEYDGEKFGCRGELSIDSVRYKEIQLTGIRGPFWIDNERVLFGSWIDRPTPGPANPNEPVRPPQSVVATIFGGRIETNGRVILGPTPRYRFESRLFEADLARCAQEMIPGRQSLKGKIQGEIDIGGFGRSLNNLSGRGMLRLYDADVYELPAMVSLLKILSIRTPDRSAFSTSDIDFRIEGEHIYCERMKFSGDAISLVGDGEVNFNTELKMKLHAMVGRADRSVPIVSDILGGASQQIMQLNVGGTLHNPEITREAFPGVNQALQQLQSDRQRDGRGWGDGSQDSQVRPAGLERLLPKKQP
jgi:hypothetical protein